MATVTGDIIRVVCGFSYTTGGRSMSNVLHYQDVGAGGVADAALLTAMGTIIEGVYGALVVQLSSELKFTTYTVQNVTQSVLIGEAPWPTLTVGGGNLNIAVAQAVSLLRMVTNKSRVWGRVNLPGLPETIVVDSFPAAVWNTAALAFGAVLLTTPVVGGLTARYVVYNRILKTSVFPSSVAVGLAVRSLGKRKVP